MLAGGSGKDHQYTLIGRPGELGFGSWELARLSYHVTVYVYSKRAMQKGAKKGSFRWYGRCLSSRHERLTRESSPCALLLQELPLS